MGKSKAEMDEYYGQDKPGLIRYCLECKRPECRDCIRDMPKDVKRKLENR